MFEFTILAAAGAATPAWPSYLQCDVQEAGWHGSTTSGKRRMTRPGR